MLHENKVAGDGTQIWLSHEMRLLAHRITGSGELTTHQSYRAPASVAEHSLAEPTTNKRCPTTHTMAKVEEEGE